MATESEECFRSVFENAAVGIARVGVDGRFLHVNDRLCEILGYARRELLERTFAEITHPDDVGVSLAAARDLLAGRSARFDLEKRYVAKGGSVVWVRLSTSLVRDVGGEPVYFVTVLQDISAWKSAEQSLRDLNAELEQRVANRTQVLEQQAVQLRRLAMQLSDAEQRERSRLATTLHDGLQQLLVAAQMRLQTSRRFVTDAGLAHLAKLNDLLNEAIRVSRSLVAELSPPVLQNAGFIEAVEWLAEWFRDKHELEVRLERKEKLPDIPRKTKIILFQIVRELLFNVVKHSDSRTAAVRLAGNHDRVQVLVEDQGRGFDPQQVAWDRSAVGFGLFNIRERLDAIGGTFQITSAPGQGTRVEVWSPPLRAASAAEAEARLTSEAVGGGPPGSNGLRPAITRFEESEVK